MNVRKLLLIDDDMLVAQLVRAVLDSPDAFDVTHVESGWRALDCIADVGPELILLDMKMPGMSGLAFLERMRGETAFGDVEARACYQAAGCIGSIAKPFDPTTLARDLRRILAGRASSSG